MVRKIADHTPVDAATTNPPLGDLEQRDEHLKALIDALHLGESVYLWSVALEPGTHVGSLVYYDPSTRVYRPAKVGLSNTESGILQSAYAIGVVTTIRTATVGDLIIFGKVKFTDTTMVDDPTVSGIRYVSAVDAGLASAVAASISLPVGFWQAEEKTLLFHPATAGNASGHKHYRFELTAQPAGSVTGVYMEPHGFLSADPSLPGWLPADAPVFGGLAPLGAKFGYNIVRHPELLAAFPPVPLASAYIELYFDGIGASVVADDIVKVTPTGIWWMRDAWGWAPWSMDISAFGPQPSIPYPTDPQHPAPAALQYGHGYMGIDNPCPVRVILWFDRPAHFTNDAMVSSLSAKEGTPYRITDCAGNPASSGDLLLDFKMDMLMEPETEPVDVALTRVVNGKFRQGPSTATVRSRHPSIKVTGAPRGEAFTGDIVLDFDDPSRQRELDTALFSLEHAKQDKYQNLFFLSLPAGIDSAVRGRVDVPGSDAANSQLYLHLQLLATAPGTLPALSWSYRRMRVPGDRRTLVMPNNSAEVTQPAVQLDSQLDGTIAQSNVYFMVKLPNFAVQSGDTVFFTLRRGVDSYVGNIGVIKVKAVMVSGE
jgi:hypothetical protein